MFSLFGILVGGIVLMFITFWLALFINDKFENFGIAMLFSWLFVVSGAFLLWGGHSAMKGAVFVGFGQAWLWFLCSVGIAVGLLMLGYASIRYVTKAYDNPPRFLFALPFVLIVPGVAGLTYFHMASRPSFEKVAQLDKAGNAKAARKMWCGLFQKEYAIRNTTCVVDRPDAYKRIQSSKAAQAYFWPAAQKDILRHGELLAKGDSDAYYSGYREDIEKLKALGHKLDPTWSMVHWHNLQEIKHCQGATSARREECYYLLLKRWKDGSDPKASVQLCKQVVALFKEVVVADDKVSSDLKHDALALALERRYLQLQSFRKTYPTCLANESELASREVTSHVARTALAHVQARLPLFAELQREVERFNNQESLGQITIGHQRYWVSYIDGQHMLLDQQLNPLFLLRRDDKGQYNGVMTLMAPGGRAFWLPSEIEQWTMRFYGESVGQTKPGLTLMYDAASDAEQDTPRIARAVWGKWSIAEEQLWLSHIATLRAAETAYVSYLRRRLYYEKQWTKAKKADALHYNRRYFFGDYISPYRGESVEVHKIGMRDVPRLSKATSKMRVNTKGLEDRVYYIPRSTYSTSSSSSSSSSTSSTSSSPWPSTSTTPSTSFGVSNRSSSFGNRSSSSGGFSSGKN